MKKKLLSILLTALFAVTIVGCGTESAEDAYSIVHEEIASGQTNPSLDKKESSEEHTSGQNPGEKESAEEDFSNQNAEDKAVSQEQKNIAEENFTKETEETSTEPEITELTFADLSKLRFEFSSGAGAWSEYFTIEKDGYFTGLFNDSDMGDAGEGYADGTRYSSSYSGHFTNLTKINEYTYQMKLADISYREMVDTVEISENVRYIYTDSYCLGDNDIFTIYLPGTPVAKLSEDARIWLSLMGQEETELSMIAIVDEANGYGMYSYDRMEPLEDAQMTFNSYKESFDYYNSLISETDTTIEWLEYSGNMYELADDCLNYIWNLVRYNVTEEEYKTILAEQREWIAEKEAQAEADAAEFGGGSFAPVMYNDTLARLTMERCEELIVYLK